MKEIVESAFRRAGFEGPPPETIRDFSRYLQEIDYWNSKMHLVGKGCLGSSLELLLLDSLALLRVVDEYVPAPKRAADIGSGAGFPGLVWKMVRPEFDMTLFERRLKPQLFLERAIAQLDLKGITVIGEDAARSREACVFDLVTSKAAGRLGGILPLAERLLVPGGAYVTIKGRSWEKEMPQRSQSSMRLEISVELPEKRGIALIFRKNTTA